MEETEQVLLPASSNYGNLGSVSIFSFFVYCVSQIVLFYIGVFVVKEVFKKRSGFVERKWDEWRWQVWAVFRV